MQLGKSFDISESANNGADEKIQRTRRYPRLMVRNIADNNVLRLLSELRGFICKMEIKDES